VGMDRVLAWSELSLMLICRDMVTLVEGLDKLPVVALEDGILSMMDHLTTHLHH